MNTQNRHRSVEEVYKKATRPKKAARPAGTATLAAPEPCVAEAVAAVPERVPVVSVEVWVAVAVVVMLIVMVSVAMPVMVLVLELEGYL